MKTHFSFEVSYPAGTRRSQAQQDQVMDSLQDSLRQQLTAQDPEAQVAVSDSHRGGGDKLVELTTTLTDAALADLLKAFSETSGVSVTAFE